MQRHSGFTIIEFLVIVVVGGILVAATIELYQRFLKIHQRQETLLQVERELGAVTQSFAQVLTSLPGRGISFYDETATENTSTRLPSLALEEHIGLKTLRLGLVTPLKINGYDAIAIVYAGRNSPRLELAAESQLVHNFGRAFAVSTTPSIYQNFRERDALLLVGKAESGEKVARIVRLRSLPTPVTIDSPERLALELNYDLCDRGSCGTALPQFRNNTRLKVFAAGSSVVKPHFIVFYAVRRGSRLQVYRNEGGAIELDLLKGSFRIEGGVDSLLGEVDQISINYLLNDDTYQETPPFPDEKWIDQIQAVQLKLYKSSPLPFGNERAERQISVEFALTARTLE